MRPAEIFDQPVIAPTAEHGALRAQPIGGEFKRCVAIIIKPAHQLCITRPGDTGGIQTRGHRTKEILRLTAQKLVNLGRSMGDTAIIRIFTIEDAQRVFLQPRQTVFAQDILMIVEIGHQRFAPGIAASRIAQRVELQRHAFLDPKFVKQLVGHHQQFDVRSRFRRTDDFGVDLVKLAITALLRAFITEKRAMRGHLHRRMLLPAIGQIGARNPGCEFRAQRDRIPAAILECVHFL